MSRCLRKGFIISAILQERPAPSRPPDTRDDETIQVSGILDSGDSHGFIRTSGYRHGPDDIYLPAAQIRQYGLRRGDYLTGAARPPRPGGDSQLKQGKQREKYP